MSDQTANLTNITAPRVPLVDERTNLISREWYRFFLSLFQLTGSGTSTINLTDLQVGPPNPEYGPIVTGGTNSVAVPTAGAVAYGNGIAYAFTGVGSAAQVLTSAGTGTPTWSTPAGGSVTSVGLTAPAVFTVTGSPVTSSGTIAITYSGTALPAINGGTAQTTYAAGDIIYANAINTLSKLTVGTTGQVLKVAAGVPSWGTTVSIVSVVSANGFAGTVATDTSTPAITLTTSISGLLKGNATAVSAAVANTDYVGISAPVTKTADFTVADGESYLINNKTGSTCTATLPAASSWSGRALTFTNYQAQTLVSASSNVVPRAGGAAGTAILAATAGVWTTLVSNGTNWLEVAGG